MEEEHLFVSNSQEEQLFFVCVCKYNNNRTSLSHTLRNSLAVFLQHFMSSKEMENRK